ncbi:MAG: NUDIX domain-containing protein [archaeon]
MATVEGRLITDPDEIERITGIAGIKEVRMNQMRGEDWEVHRRFVLADRFNRQPYVDEVTYLPKNKDGFQVGFQAGSGSSVLPIDNDLGVYFAEIYAYHGQFHGFFAAGGGIKQGETPEEAGKRETEEELGMKFRRMIRLGVKIPSPGLISCPQHMYAAVGELQHGQQRLDTTESKMKKVRLHLDEAYEIAMNPDQDKFDMQTHGAVLQVYCLNRDGKLFNYE